MSAHGERSLRWQGEPARGLSGPQHPEGVANPPRFSGVRTCLLTICETW